MEADGRCAQHFIEACCAVQYDDGPKLMAASVKNAEMFAALIAAGAQAITIKPEFAICLVQDTITNAAIAQFDADAKESVKG
jgi:hypothetical protein